MNRKKFTAALIAMMMVSVIGLGAVACKKTEPTETTPESSEITTTTTTTVPTTTLTEWKAPLNATEEVTWNETQLEQEETYYVKVSKGEFLNVRKGPNTTYEKIGTLTRGQTVTVVAKTNSGWYKTKDGYYIFQDYLTKNQPD